MKKKLGWGIAAMLAVYALMLSALIAVESASSDSGIHTFADALWYSLVTITTVGYGDLYPVTPAGRVIGVFFLMLSLGFLAFIVSTVYSLIKGRFWPSLILRIHRRKTWFLFSCANSASLALADNLSKTNPDSIQVFLNAAMDAEGRRTHPNRVYLPDDAAQILERSGAHSGPRNVFLISDDEFRNCDEAHALKSCGASLYCQSQEACAIPNTIFFDPFDSCARLFWHTHPLRRSETCILLVGSGRYARSMLSSAVITNCLTPIRTIRYHLFGDWSAYRREHYCLDRAVSFNDTSDSTDTLFFHDSIWNEDADLIAQADRIIFCFDDDDENARCAQMLQRCFPHTASVYVRTARQMVPGVRFGAPESLYTQELVMKRRLDHLAMQMHDRYCRSTGKPMPGWDELDAFTRESNRSAADHIAAKVRLLLDTDETADADSCKRAALRWQQADDTLREICRRNEHDRWIRFYCLHNWQYAPVRMNAARRHPSLLPYEQLSEQERAKDDYAWQLLAECAQIQEQL